MNKKTWRLVLWILLVWLAANLLLPKHHDDAAQSVLFHTVKATYSQGDKVSLLIENRFPYALEFDDECPDEPFIVKRDTGTGPTEITATASVTCMGLPVTIQPKQKYTVDYGPWDHELFWEIGTYSIEGKFRPVDSTTVAEGSDVSVGPTPESTEPEYTFTTTFNVKKRGIFSLALQKVFYQPIYNFLIFLTSVMPGYNLGLAIIILTIAVRSVLFVPTLHSLKSQHAMQQLQPKLQAVRDLHKGDQQKLAQETMRLYKEHGVNPFGSCLPILVQMPFLFAVFFVLRSGLDPSNMYLLYGPLRGFDLASVSHHFLTFDMTMHEPLTRAACTAGRILCFNPRALIFPVIVGGLQGLSAWLMTKKAAAKTQVATQEAQMQQKTMNVMMVYLLPIMVGWFAIMYPTGLSMYWATTTLFSIGQQWYLRRRYRAPVITQEAR